jgi:hypothetical protein
VDLDLVSISDQLRWPQRLHTMTLLTNVGQARLHAIDEDGAAVKSERRGFPPPSCSELRNSRFHIGSIRIAQ